MFSKQKNDCPFWKGPCKEHECRLYTHIQGKTPQSEVVIDKWGCTFEFLPMLMIENSQQQRQTGAAVESFRNEVARQQDQLMSLPNTMLNAQVTAFQTTNCLTGNKS